MTTFFDTRLGTAPCRAREPAVIAALATGLMVAIAAAIAFVALTPPYTNGWPDAHRIALSDLPRYLGDTWVDHCLWVRVGLALACAAVGGLAAGLASWHRTPLSDCAVAMPHPSQPRLHRDEYARLALAERLRQGFGHPDATGLWLAPGVRLPREAEGQYLLIVGDKGSGKSNIARALASQAIARGDRVLLHCVKGDVSQSFRPGEAALIAAHHAHGWAWDAAADLHGEAAYLDLAAAVIPISGSSAFWAQSARAVFVDVLSELASEPGRTTWTFRDLAERLLDDPAAIKARVERLDLSASPLIEEGEEGLTNTTFGVMATLWAGTLNGVRPLALAWGRMPPERQFSVRRWLRGEGPGTVIVQTAPEYQELSTLVAGSLLRCVAVGVSDPSLPVDPQRRVTLVLDEFHALGRIDRLETALATGREKGLVVIGALQSLNQVPLVYGPVLGQVVRDLFRIRIFSALAAGTSADQAEALMKRRTLVWWEINTDLDKKGRFKTERGELPLVSATTLERDLGVHQVGSDPKNPGHKVVRAVIAGLGDVYQFDWPLTVWPKRREGFVPAAWLSAGRRRAPAPSEATGPARPA
ncbi:energy-coupling factor transporter ATP-binding protein EcfA2 [Methylobacterium fujisawaense]|uniref:Energy-coupling factor transporter ATP-binding protein EcfA2 n=1 Tax=Methylobacterium fujisawaense TaxID=107400 RepID=A0ABR6D5Z5_9HYPH|nr:energy-coupling factor transporter ATP-binding protein EcfA2 [Methylobacterium fujisawaense]